MHQFNFLTESLTNINNVEGSIITLIENECYEGTQLLPETIRLLATKKINQDKIVLRRQIGQGHFGKVFKGNLHMRIRNIFLRYKRKLNALKINCNYI